MTLTKLSVGWCGGILLVFGVAYVLAASPMLALAGLVELPPGGLSDLRVMYGALQIVPGAFLLSAFRAPAQLRLGALYGAATFACIASIRILSIVLDGSANQYHLAALAVEIPTALLAFAGYKKATAG